MAQAGTTYGRGRRAFVAPSLIRALSREVPALNIRTVSKDVPTFTHSRTVSQEKPGRPTLSAVPVVGTRSPVTTVRAPTVQPPVFNGKCTREGWKPGALHFFNHIQSLKDKEDYDNLRRYRLNTDLEMLDATDAKARMRDRTMSALQRADEEEFGSCGSFHNIWGEDEEEAPPPQSQAKQFGQLHHSVSIPVAITAPVTLASATSNANISKHPLLSSKPAVMRASNANMPTLSSVPAAVMPSYASSCAQLPMSPRSASVAKLRSAGFSGSVSLPAAQRGQRTLAPVPSYSQVSSRPISTPVAKAAVQATKATVAAPYTTSGAKTSATVTPKATVASSHTASGATTAAQPLQATAASSYSSYTTSGATSKPTALASSYSQASSPQKQVSPYSQVSLQASMRAPIASYAAAGARTYASNVQGATVQQAPRAGTTVQQAPRAGYSSAPQQAPRAGYPNAQQQAPRAGYSSMPVSRRR